MNTPQFTFLVFLIVSWWTSRVSGNHLERSSAALYWHWLLLIYASLFIRKTDSTKKMKTMTIRTRKAANINKLGNSETIFNQTAPWGGIFNIKPFNAVWQQITWQVKNRDKMSGDVGWTRLSVQKADNLNATCNRSSLIAHGLILAKLQNTVTLDLKICCLLWF